MSALLRLYPRAWRARYGAELEDLVAHRPLGLGGAIDLARGALDAHLHPELVDPVAAENLAGVTAVSPERYEDLRVARRLGRGAWFGSALWVAGLVIAASGPIVYDTRGSYRDGAAGMPFILVAGVLLAAGLLGQLVRLPRGSRMARAGAIAAVIAWPIWSLAPWNMVFLVVGLAGVSALAVGARLAGAWSTGAALAAVGSAVGAGTLMAVSLFGVGAGRATELLDPLVIGIFAMTPIWLVVGGTLQRLPPVAPTGDGSGRGTATEATA
jgi:hypothetical protein